MHKPTLTRVGFSHVSSESCSYLIKRGRILFSQPIEFASDFITIPSRAMFLSLSFLAECSWLTPPYTCN